MRAIRLPPQSPEQIEALEELYHKTRDVRLRTRAQMMLLAAEKEGALGRIYILAGRRPVTIRELMSEIAKQAGVRLLPVSIPARPIQLHGTVVETLCQPFGIEPPIYRRRVDFFTKDRSFDTTRARTELGFEPAQDFSVEVANIYRWYKEQGWL